ncbi:ATPase, AAA-type, core [Cordyceps fumosorosea ARSEF 2679]|uniref:ATPase, AAA-type, core n=1 Tax=Cordyceps fumosorosea (strain ARSEF 2679) TaxID=1081104 RepID=A0A167Q4W4_CORFA|nr:ATPase, AAA-type, core [Cordyceps fumosorosea ARSEF 2679]OAA57294.1 ATPase, AAA-type, core [Cordyceps fumosorosea ARSEF 2679]
MAVTRKDSDNASETASENAVDTPVTDASQKADNDSKEVDSDNDSKEGDGDSKAAEKIIIGMVAETKDVFAKFDADGNRSWSDKPPSDLEEAPENETTKKYAIIVRKKKPRRASSTKPLEIDSLIIQSPLLKRALGDIMQDYPGITTDVARLKFYAPFECFVHRWEEFEEAVADEDRDATTREHLQLLHAILTDELGATIQLRQDYFKNKAVDFEHCWFLFTPGCTVLTELHGQPMAARFDSGNYMETACGKFYSVTCSYIDWDGAQVGWVEKEARIPQFLGTTPFSKLSCYPLEHHPQRAAVEEQLRGRGRRWEALRGFHYKAYSGVALYSPDQKALTRERVTCRVVIDGARWDDANPSFSFYISETIHEADQAQADYVMPSLNHFHVLLASPVVRGYALKNKRWMQFFVDGMSEIEFQQGAFDSLVLSEERKRLILAFAESQARHRDSFDDVVHGKGRGVIMLLAGGPGIGKTLTAEVVAEQMRVPLYAMSAGDLGSSSYDVDENLTKLMGMVSNWNAVLLLDECDVFLEARSSADLERNRIVSIFLRTLEYYEGILFLTTNRVADMDAAFASRVHLTLEYPDLDKAARRAIWGTFLGRAGATGVGDEALEVLSEISLNGRQIKNIMKMAQLLAMQTGSGDGVAFVHVQTVLRIQGYKIPEK